MAKRAPKIAKNDPNADLKVFITSTVRDAIQESETRLETRLETRFDEKIEETKRHMEMLNEATRSDIRLIAEQCGRLHDRVAAIEKQIVVLDVIENDVAAIKNEVISIRVDMGHKVDMREYQRLEKRVAKLEAKIR